MSDIKLSVFPSDEAEAIAYLYVQKKDYVSLTPEILAEEYMDAYERIKPLLNKPRKAHDWFSNQK